jgi:hypothetical protein
MSEDQNWNDRHRWAALNVNNADTDYDEVDNAYSQRAAADDARARRHAGMQPDKTVSQDLLEGSEAHLHGAVEVRTIIIITSLLYHHTALLQLTHSLFRVLVDDQDIDALPRLPRAGFHIRTNIPARMDRYAADD